MHTSSVCCVCKAVAQLFSRIDVDKSGTIDRRELSEAVGTLSDPSWSGILDCLGLSIDGVEVLMFICM